MAGGWRLDLAGAEAAREEGGEVEGAAGAHGRPVVDLELLRGGVGGVLAGDPEAGPELVERGDAGGDPEAGGGVMGLEDEKEIRRVRAGVAEHEGDASAVLAGFEVGDLDAFERRQVGGEDLDHRSRNSGSWFASLAQTPVAVKDIGIGQIVGHVREVDEGLGAEERRGEAEEGAGGRLDEPVGVVAVGREPGGQEVSGSRVVEDDAAGVAAAGGFPPADFERPGKVVVGRVELELADVGLGERLVVQPVEIGPLEGTEAAGIEQLRWRRRRRALR